MSISPSSTWLQSLMRSQSLEPSCNLLTLITKNDVVIASAKSILHEMQVQVRSSDFSIKVFNTSSAKSPSAKPDLRNRRNPSSLTKALSLDLLEVYDRVPEGPV